MAKKTETKTVEKKPAAKKAAPAAKKAPKAEKKAAGPRHPKARVVAAYTSKEALAKTLSESLAREDQDPSSIASSLKTASNAQLLRLAKVVDAVKQKYGSRAKLIAALGTKANKSKDKDYLAKLDTYSLPQLLDLAR